MSGLSWPLCVPFDITHCSVLLAPTPPLPQIPGPRSPGLVPPPVALFGSSHKSSVHIVKLRLFLSKRAPFTSMDAFCASVGKGLGYCSFLAKLSLHYTIVNWRRAYKAVHRCIQPRHSTKVGMGSPPPHPLWKPL